MDRPEAAAAYSHSSEGPVIRERPPGERPVLKEDGFRYVRNQTLHQCAFRLSAVYGVSPKTSGTLEPNWRRYAVNGSIECRACVTYLKAHSYESRLNGPELFRATYGGLGEESIGSSCRETSRTLLPK